MEYQNMLLKKDEKKFYWPPLIFVFIADRILYSLIDEHVVFNRHISDALLYNVNYYLRGLSGFDETTVRKYMKYFEKSGYIGMKTLAQYRKYNDNNNNDKNEEIKSSVSKVESKKRIYYLKPKGVIAYLLLKEIPWQFGNLFDFEQADDFRTSYKFSSSHIADFFNNSPITSAIIIDNFHKFDWHKKGTSQGINNILKKHKLGDVKNFLDLNMISQRKTYREYNLLHFYLEDYCQEDTDEKDQDLDYIESQNDYIDYFSLKNYLSDIHTSNTENLKKIKSKLSKKFNDMGFDEWKIRPDLNLVCSRITNMKDLLL